MNHQVFICYASEDKPTADAACAILERNQVRCWIAPRDVLPAEDYGQAIVRAMSTSRLVVFVFSASANASPHVKRELEGAVSHGIPILPFRIEDISPSDSLQYYLGGIHWLDALTPPLEEHLEHLAGTVKILLARNEPALHGNRTPVPRPPVPPPPTPEPSTPARGLPGRRRAWLIGLVALVVIGAGIGVGLAVSQGGGGSSGTHGTSVAAPPPPTTGTAGSDLAIARKACTLVDPADMQAVYRSTPGPGDPDGETGACRYPSPLPDVMIEHENATQSDFTASRQAAGTVVDVTGLGGGAYFSSYTADTVDLTVFDTGRSVVFTLIAGTDNDTVRGQLVNLAKLTLARAHPE